MNELRCAVVGRNEGLDPLGSAGSYRGFLLVDWPLPWPPKLEEAPGIGPIVAALKGTGIRLQGVVPGAGDTRRAVLYVRPTVGDAAGGDVPGGGFAGYRRVERAGEPGAGVDSLVALALGLLASADEVAGGPGAPPAPGAHGPVGDLLVCTHGRRDVCCGALGTTLAAELLADTDIAKAGYQVGRTSHTGGHRFAPTAILLPEGTMWAFLDADLVSRVARRDGPVEAVLDNYRGSTGLGSPALQALERVAFGDVGWGWLDWVRSGTDGGAGRVTLTGTSPEGESRTWAAEATTRTVPVPDCGKPLDQARKTAEEPVLGPVARG